MFLTGFLSAVRQPFCFHRAMELANKFGARFALIVGENEMAAGRYALKNLTTGEQHDLTLDEIAAKLAAATNHN